MTKQEAVALAAKVQERRPQGRQAEARPMGDSEFWPKDSWWVFVYTPQGMLEFSVEDPEGERLGMDPE